MSLFSEKCARCGRRTKDRHEGKPTCESCRKVLELKLAATGEQPRACPIDGTAMTKTVAHMMIIDRCPTCHGVWLDAGELDCLTDEVASQAMMAIARGVMASR